MKRAMTGWEEMLLHSGDWVREAFFEGGSMLCF